MQRCTAFLTLYLIFLFTFYSTGDLWLLMVVFFLVQAPASMYAAACSPGCPVHVLTSASLQLVIVVCCEAETIYPSELRKQTRKNEIRQHLQAAVLAQQALCISQITCLSKSFS